eukprot:TRINITY_DN28844_c0_g1_i1.p1 TRINITY_DN28844_c0_g1~~TRINITY_DN28844_c0_g1_i1.p1  ORF type:complete len:214 (+),score=22.45 TRINITY_DN28844_c0_g1_i1:30-644(+)
MVCQPCHTSALCLRCIVFAVLAATLQIVRAGVEQDAKIRAAVEEHRSRLKDWKRPSDSELMKTLSELQVRVTRMDGTERAFNNEYWNEKRSGLYVDVVSGEPLYSSADKFDSGTGWPSFTRALPGVELGTSADYKLREERTEMRSPIADSHLGHIFNDGPRDRGGMRHCVNSASLRFVPVSEMDEAGFASLRKVLFPSGKGSEL